MPHDLDAQPAHSAVRAVGADGNEIPDSVAEVIVIIERTVVIASKKQVHQSRTTVRIVVPGTISTAGHNAADLRRNGNCGWSRMEPRSLTGILADSS